MATWSSFYPSLLVHVKGCSEPLMDQELRDAAREYFRRSRAWQQWLSAVTVVGGEREYPLPVPDDAQVWRIDAATVNGAPIDILSWRSFAADVDETPGDAAGITTRDRIVFTLARELPADTLVKLRATLLPTDTAAGIPDDQFAQHREAIVAGARYRLQKLPGRPFSDVSLAAVAKGEFEAAIGAAGIDAYRGNTAATPRLRPTWC